MNSIFLNIHDFVYIILFGLIFFLHAVLPYLDNDPNYFWAIVFGPVCIIWLALTRIFRIVTMLKYGLHFEKTYFKILKKVIFISFFITCPMFYGIQYGLFYKVTNQRFDKVNNITLLNFSKTVIT